MSDENLIKLIKNDGSHVLLDSIPGIKLNIRGGNNKITIYEGTSFRNCIISVMSNMDIEIKRSRFGIVKLQIFGTHSQVCIGESFSCWGVEIRCHEPNGFVSIGNNCMFANDILLYPTDVHTIYNQETKEVLNIGKPIIIEDHVWCGRDVLLLKGSYVSKDSVIASSSVISKNFKESNIIIGGVAPGHVLKKGINWTRENPSQYREKISQQNKLNGS